ncbi:uncharacterized protein LDX57_002787 [Aspergillus melleus]|uniref:uncharacterized protein n=1 Tax=Aspergillus melleus TaxID=138277 RepID=UPI001E8CF651|nr:uncharacterized protein LDX57_002787 [Aspergillus melleus]KAH8425038.1 hypothetical protein LDX57_002787 [Aspergillus melleus]
MSGSENWNSYEWTLPQMTQDTATIPIPNAEVGQNFLLNSESNWASNGGHSHGTGVDETMQPQNALVNFSPSHGLAFGSSPVSLTVSGAGVNIGAGSPYFAHDSSSNDDMFETSHAAFSAYAKGMSAPDMVSLSPSSLVGDKTDDTEDEPATPSDNHAPTLTSVMDPNDSNRLVPNLVKLMKVAENDPSDRPTLFKSHEHARSSYQTSGPLPDDPTIPQTPSQKRAIVKEMCKAMLSLEHATDNEGMIKPFRNKKYSEERIEICCWQTLDTVIMRQKSGPLLAAYELTTKNENETLNFAQRMTRIIECFYRHKTVCKHILDPLYVYNLVDNPTAAEKRVESNKLLNRRKGHIMTAGKEALRIGQRRQPATTPTASSQKARRTIAQKASRTAAAARKTVTRKAPRAKVENKEKKLAAIPAYSDTSESSNVHERIFTPSSTPEPTASEADASPQSLVASMPCSSSMPVPQAMAYYPQHVVNGEPTYQLNNNLPYPARNKGYQSAFWSNVHSHRMAAPASYSLPALDFTPNHAASYYPTGSMADLHVNSSPISGGTVCHNAMATPVRSAKASRNRPSITITDNLGQPSSVEKKRR